MGKIMSRDTIPFACEDLSALAKSLRKQLMSCESFPSHVEMLNILAKANGYRNYQHLKQAQEDVEVTEMGLNIALPRKLQPFMSVDYVLHSWPVKYSLQKLSLWFFACRFQYQQRYSEREVNEIISRYEAFGDFARIRRELVNQKLLGRTMDGRDYWRTNATPPDDLKLLADYWP